MLKDLPPYRSHSQLTGWLKCPEQYHLERREGIPTVPGVGAVAGQAVHLATEKIDQGEWPNDPVWAWEQARAEKVRDEFDKSGIPSDRWRISGRKTKEWPLGEDWNWWNQKGPQQIANWHNFISNSRYTLIPDLIEIEVNAEIGGVMVKGFLDRVAVNDDGEAGVIDLKSGAYQPKGSMQLGLYRYLLNKTVGLDPVWGAFFMTRRGVLTAPVKLEKWSDDRLDTMVRAINGQIVSGEHWPQPNMLCKACGVNAHCWAYEEGMDD